MLVYLITNLVNGKRYVGMTKGSLHRRWQRHLYQLKNSQAVLHRAIRKYGADSFEHRELAMPMPQTHQALQELEKFCIIQMGSKSPAGYNLTDGGDGFVGAVFSEEHRRHLSESRKGRVCSEESRRKMSASRIGNKNSLGKKFSLGGRLNVSLAQMGNKNNLGHKHSEEIRMKMRASQTARWQKCKSL